MHREKAVGGSLWERIVEVALEQWIEPRPQPSSRFQRRFHVTGTQYRIFRSFLFSCIDRVGESCSPEIRWYRGRFRPKLFIKLRAFYRTFFLWNYRGLQKKEVLIK